MIDNEDRIGQFLVPRIFFEDVEEVETAFLFSNEAFYGSSQEGGYDPVVVIEVGFGLEVEKAGCCCRRSQGDWDLMEYQIKSTRLGGHLTWHINMRLHEAIHEFLRVVPLL